MNVKPSRKAATRGLTADDMRRKARDKRRTLDRRQARTVKAATR